MKRTVFRKLLTVLAATLVLCALVYPLMLPSENYFRMVLQVLPLTLVSGVIMLIPLYVMSSNLSRKTANELKRLRLDSKSTLAQFPELRPVARQIASLRAQIDTQMNELTGQQAQLKVLTDNMQEGLLLVSAVGRVLSCNPAAFTLLDTRPSEEDFFLVYDLNKTEAFTRLVQRALNGIRGSAVIQVNESAVQIIATPVSGEGSMSGAVLVLLDVTEREQRDELRREFTSNVSHELKTPLTSIYGIADMMKSGMVREKDISGFAARICDESSRMISLVEDIIRLSRLDDESFSEEVVPLDLYKIAQSVLEQLRTAAETRNIQITLEGSEALMQGVPVIVEEMLYNLCDNAIKYNKEGGTVRVKVAGTGQQTVFEVSDTGIGIPQADRMRIFERFYRVDKSHSRQIGGTGLGLSIVKHGAQFHHGTIEVSSQLGEGTTIRLFFPLNAEAAEEAECTAQKDPLNVDVPGAPAHALIQVLETEPEEVSVPDSTEAELPEELPSADADEPEAPEYDSDDSEPADEAEPLYETEPDAEDDAVLTEPEPEQMPEAEESASEETKPEEPAEESAEEPEEEVPEEIPETAPEAEPEAEPVPEEDAEEIDETEALFREAEAALNLGDLIFDDEKKSSKAAAPAEEPKPAETPKPLREKLREIDVVPIDEDTMDIKI